MATKLPIDYWGIETEIKEILSDALKNSGFTIEMEKEIMFSPEQSPWVCVYIDRRDAPPDRQTLSGGRRVLYRIRFIIWVACYALEKERSIRDCANAVAQVEGVLMRERTLHGKVDVTWLQGGALASTRAQGGTGSDFLSIGEIILLAETSLTVS